MEKGKIMMKRIFGMSLLFMMVSVLVFAHGGGLDSNGGHYNRKTGVYHYHRQPAAKTQSPAGKSSTPSNQNISPDTSQKVEKAFWINSSSGVRHNNKCRYFGKTKNGKYCGANEGRACKLCGG